MQLKFLRNTFATESVLTIITVMCVEPYSYARMVPKVTVGSVTCHLTGGCGDLGPYLYSTNIHNDSNENVICSMTANDANDKNYKFKGVCVSKVGVIGAKKTKEDDVASCVLYDKKDSGARKEEAVNMRFEYFFTCTGMTSGLTTMFYGETPLCVDDRPPEGTCT